MQSAYQPLPLGCRTYVRVAALGDGAPRPAETETAFKRRVALARCKNSTSSTKFMLIWTCHLSHSTCESAKVGTGVLRISFHCYTVLVPGGSPSMTAHQRDIGWYRAQRIVEMANQIRASYRLLLYPKASNMAGDLLLVAHFASLYASSRHVDEMCRVFSPCSGRFMHQ